MLVAGGTDSAVPGSATDWQVCGNRAMPNALVKSGLAAAAALVSLSAQAADMPIKARPAPQAMNWSGCYLGYALVRTSLCRNL